ncbi:glycosyltransferase [Gloeocapsopsis sp. IPPAS B-1203]|uniref:glycosyltransferase family 2 protein n=1 Tax=Gloeocapsopsis sp. IPPAS B-1203 TaxID=2049454 RepID=UPI000C175F3C|nr:glycosyltransferase [Gloeocapsopsis sp. IPPAS B-1203]PIG92080.1 glycosyl transferase family 2 [Gloeocapsopsis sp. IPPAS B-1203]
MSKPQVTIVVSPRERFSCAQASLESIYEHTRTPFNLIYVDGGSPAKIKRYLEKQAIEKQFQLIRTEHYLSPNKARNLGLAQVNSEYVVFIDNDVVVTPGWLQQLVKCAEETKATVVSPLICQGEPVHEEVHCAGGESRVKIETSCDRTRRRIVEKIYKQGRKVADVLPQLQRHQTGLAEFHCMMVRTEIFEQIGMLDEAILNTKEHVDFCMTVMETGGSVYLEPESIVTYVPGPPLELTDMPFYMLRWSDAWELTSLHRLRDKWNLTEDEYFKNRYNGLGWRRKTTIIKPLSRKISKTILRRQSKKVEDLLVSVDKALNKYLTNRYARKQLQMQPSQTPQLQQSPTTV